MGIKLTGVLAARRDRSKAWIYGILALLHIPFCIIITIMGFSMEIYDAQIEVIIGSICLIIFLVIIPGGYAIKIFRKPKILFSIDADTWMVHIHEEKVSVRISEIHKVWCSTDYAHGYSGTVYIITSKKKYKIQSVKNGVAVAEMLKLMLPPKKDEE